MSLPRALQGTTAGRRPGNKLLAQLPPADLARILPLLRTIAVPVRHVFHVQGSPIRDVVFLNGGVASVTTVMQDGRTVEAATVGTEGLLGMEAVLGGDLATGQNVMQVPGTDAELMPLGVFRAEMRRGGPFFDGVQRYSQGMLALLMHSTACMALHEVQERCCRWLLMTHDRVAGDHFHLSHEFLSIMLGTTRPTVTIAAVGLQKDGLIAYRHGKVTIIDRAGLEARACECYGTVRAQFDRLRL